MHPAPRFGLSILTSRLGRLPVRGWEGAGTAGFSSGSCVERPVVSGSGSIGATGVTGSATLFITNGLPYVTTVPGKVCTPPNRSWRRARAAAGHTDQKRNKPPRHNRQQDACRARRSRHRGGIQSKPRSRSKPSSMSFVPPSRPRAFWRQPESESKRRVLEECLRDFECSAEFSACKDRSGRERPGILEGAACAQDKRVRTDCADDLEADREPVARQSAGNGRRRLTASG